MMKIPMNKEDIKYVRKREVGRPAFPVFTVQYSSDNVNWFDLLDYPPEWLCDLIVDVLTTKSLYQPLLPEDDIPIDEDDEVELNVEVIRRHIGYSINGNSLYIEE